MSMFRPAGPAPDHTIGAEEPPDAATSFWMWTILYLATLASAAWKLPSRIEEATTTLSPELRRDTGNERLADLAIRLGAYLGLLLLAIALLLIVLVLRYYERQLPGTRALLPATRLALGPSWVSAATGRVADSALSSGAISLGTLAAFALSMSVTCAVFARRTTPGGRPRTILAIGLSTALSVLT